MQKLAMSFLLFLVVSGLPAQAELDASVQEGLQKTKALLTNPTDRNKAIEKDPKAQDVDRKMKALVGEENGEQVYKIAAEVFERIVQESKGDPEKLKAMMEQAQKDPQGFYKQYLSEQDKAGVRGIATGVENRRPHAPHK